MSTAEARAKSGIKPSLLDVFIARAEARATLWATGELTLHDAVDELWAAAVRDGLVAKLGPDRVQQILADAFAPVRDDLPRAPADDAWSASGWQDAAIQYHQARGKRTLIVELSAERLAALRELMAENVSLAHASHELNSAREVPLATLKTAEFLVQQGDITRLRQWLAKHTAEERMAIREHLEAKLCRSRKSN